MNPPGGWGHAFVQYMGIELWRIPIVMLSAVGIYLAFLFFVRFFGVRVLSGWNGFDAVIIIMFGAVAGRVIIGHPPTLASGIIGLGTLMLLESAFGAAQTTFGFRTMATRPRVLVAHGEFVPRNLRKAHLTRLEIYAALRKRGITHLENVQGVVLEQTGQLSVFVKADAIDPRLLMGVVDADLILYPEKKRKKA